MYRVADPGVKSIRKIGYASTVEKYPAVRGKGDARVRIADRRAVQDVQVVQNVGRGNTITKRQFREIWHLYLIFSFGTNGFRKEISGAMSLVTVFQTSSRSTVSYA